MGHMSAPRLLAAIGVITVVGLACSSKVESKPRPSNKSAEKASAPAGSPFLARSSHPRENVWVAGQPSLGDLESVKAAGVTVVANLRGAREPTGFADEKKTVEGLGMQYAAIPVSGPTDVSMAKAKELEKLLEQHKGDKVLLHCASGNRIGALMALLAFDKGKSVDEAIADGRKAGLRGLAPIVRSKLSAMKR